MVTNAPDIAIWYADESIETRVREWFTGQISGTEPDGARSIRIPHPDKKGHLLKIKGAGFRGGPIHFGQHWKSGPRAPVFDFDGRMMEDVASGHDNAYKGGASFQQAVVEYRMSRLFEELGYDVVPCLGYGRIRVGGYTSWFSLFELDEYWESLDVPKFSIGEYGEANIQMGRFLVDVAIKHQIIGHCWYVGTQGGKYFLKDLHPFRSADAMNMSQLSWVMQLFFVLHTRSLAAMGLPRAAGVENVPEDIQAYPFRGFLPDATKAEHEALRWALVAPYMLRPPESFDQAALIQTLRDNRITSTLLELCPEQYARP